MSQLFNPHKSLMDLKVVRLSIFSTIFLAAVSLLILLLSGNLRYRLDYLGLKFSLEYFSVPISLCALNIPIIALFSANHRSEQTREQMRISSSQNTFANHYKHMEEFEKYLIRAHERMQKNVEILNSLPKDPPQKTSEITYANYCYVDPSCYRQLYIKIYPRSIDGNYEISKIFLTKIEIFISTFFRALDGFSSSSPEIWKAAHNQACIIIDTFQKENNLVNYYSIDFSSIQALAKGLKNSIYSIDLILRYDPKYTPSVWVDKVTRTDFNVLPNEDVGKIQTINVRQILKYSETAFR